MNRHLAESLDHTVNPRKLEHGFRMIRARIPYTLPLGHQDSDVPTFGLLLYSKGA